MNEWIHGWIDRFEIFGKVLKIGKSIRTALTQSGKDIHLHRFPITCTHLNVGGRAALLHVLEGLDAEAAELLDGELVGPFREHAHLLEGEFELLRLLGEGDVVDERPALEEREAEVAEPLPHRGLQLVHHPVVVVHEVAALVHAKVACVAERKRMSRRIEKVKK